MSDTHLSLRLIGYYGCIGHGFAMALYGQNEGANTLYLAHCSIPGDHDAAIEAFEPVDVNDQRRLPHGESLAVKVGDPWRDVFIWNDAAYVGTPEQLWAELTPQHADVEARAPLSLLELALHARRTEVAALAPVAFTFVRQRFGEPKARNWRRQFVRQQVEVALRQALIAHQLGDGPFQAVALREASPDMLTLDLPESLRLACQEKTIEAAIAPIAQLAASLGASLAPLPPGGVREPPAPVEPVAPVSEPARPASIIWDDVPVLVIAEGKRARDIVRHLRSETNRFNPRWGIMIGNEVVAKRDEMGTKSVIAVVLDEDEKGVARLPADVDRFLEQQAAIGALILVVPALPITHPSALFEPQRGRMPRMVHAVLDTAIARSPFWWGNAKRSFDRRISDVLQLALNVAQSSVVRRELLEPRAGEGIPVLSVGIVPQPNAQESSADEPGGLRLGSEASWVAGDPKRRDPAILFSVRINPDEAKGLHYESQLIVEGRRRENRFPEFAGRVLAAILGRRNGAPFGSERRVEQLSGFPHEIADVMQTPDYSAVFAIGGRSREDFSLVITGETPSLDAVEQADRKGWRIARYTDTATLRRLSDDAEPAGSFPDEIDIGVVRSHEIHRRLATRGIDQRDVVRISYDLLSEWLDEIPPAERGKVRRHARPLRSATRPYGEPENDHLVLRDYVLGPEPAARRLLSLITSQGKRLPDRRPMKRSSDLYRCWTPPSSGLQRYAIVDGAVPAILLQLREEEVPLQDLFVIDGDLAVPTLFRSRVFAVWARATLPAASSWMARFSVANTFGGFPIADIFRIIGQEGSLAALAMDGAPVAIGELAQEISQHIDRALASQPSGSWKEAHRSADDLPAMHRLNELVLNAYNLPGDAPDIKILRRLQEMNAAFDLRR